MRALVVLLLASGLATAETWSLYACMATTKEYVVGAKLLPSGVFRRVGPGQWKQSGHPNPFMYTLDYDRHDPTQLYVAAGNGIIHIQRDQRPWQILTGSDVTEMRDVTVAPDGAIYYAWVAGIRVSRDGGSTWTEIGTKLPHKYTEVIRLDQHRSGTLIAGTEDGIYRSSDDGGSWQRGGATGFSVMDIEQSPHDPCYWLAATERGGLFASRDCGKSFENLGHFGVDKVLYDVAFDPWTPGRVAVAGWGTGVAVSDDNGKTWSLRNSSLPGTDVWSVAFDPGTKHRMFASVHEQALFVSDDSGQTWKRDGLDGSVVYRMRFVPEGR